MIIKQYVVFLYFRVHDTSTQCLWLEEEANKPWTILWTGGNLQEQNESLGVPRNTDFIIHHSPQNNLQFIK